MGDLYRQTMRWIVRVTHAWSESRTAQKLLVFPTATPGLLAVRCICRKQKRGRTRTTNPNVMITAWPSWDVISMDVRRGLI